ncbi:DNRLRE domain-containing protein [Corallococcus aberystwythensis]|uniref:DNRLRE domain-containing protein n=1 Tax=Corallococcus aberystwythensis TaxID=2316722 RepID=A0A3A8R166_9BACT|nr:DNRLRE domain-containing protein [Corallococcus aberystwythensis]RKH74766.1 DNRLRE domain-containing protein [Corallococcus aberystwythensis]
MSLKCVGSAAGLSLLLLTGTGCGPEGAGAPDEQELADEEVAPMPEGQQASALTPGLTNYAIASADARTDADAPSTNYGDTTRLRADRAPLSESFLRFEFVGLGAPVNNAKLRLYATSGSSGTLSAWPVSNDWTESTLTWDNRPLYAGAGPVLNTPLPVEDESWVELDATGVVQGDGVYSFSVGMGSQDGASFVSRNSSLEQLRPVLFVNTEPANCTPGTLVESYEVNLPDRVFHVSESSPGSRLSRSTSLWVDADVGRETFLSFIVDPRGRHIKRAILSLRSRDDGTREGPSLYNVVPGTWTPESRTWNTRPQLEPSPLTGMGAVPPFTTVKMDVTGLVRSGTGTLGSNGTGFRVELGLRSDSSDGVEFYSPYVASDAVWPKLTLYFDRPCPP